MDRVRTFRVGSVPKKGAPLLSPWHRSLDADSVYESNPGDPESAYGRYSRFTITKCVEDGDTWWMLESNRPGEGVKDFDTLADAKAYAEALAAKG